MIARGLTLVRSRFSERSTVGRLFVNGAYECWTLEDRTRPAGEKVPGRTAIPAGSYLVQVTYSPRFKVPLPLVEAVTGFEGIRIHAGNTDEDTEGCILVGRLAGPKPDYIGESRLALAALMEKLPARAAVPLSIVEVHSL